MPSCVPTSHLWALDRSLDHRQILQFFGSTRRHATGSPTVEVGQQRPASQIFGPSFGGQVLRRKSPNPKMVGVNGPKKNRDLEWLCPTWRSSVSYKMSFCFSKSSEPHEWVPKSRMCIVRSSCQTDTKQCSDNRMEKATSIRQFYRNLKCLKWNDCPS